MLSEVLAVITYLLGVNLAMDHYPEAFAEKEKTMPGSIAKWFLILAWPFVELFNLFSKLKKEI